MTAPLEQRMRAEGVRIEYLDAEADRLGRRRFVLDWPGRGAVKERAQCFFAPPAEVVERLLGNLKEAGR